jgi:hypothetical protein
MLNARHELQYLVADGESSLNLMKELETLGANLQPRGHVFGFLIML